MDWIGVVGSESMWVGESWTGWGFIEGVRRFQGFKEGSKVAGFKSRKFAGQASKVPRLQGSRIPRMADLQGSKNFKIVRLWTFNHISKVPGFPWFPWFQSSRAQGSKRQDSRLGRVQAWFTNNEMTRDTQSNSNIQQSCFNWYKQVVVHSKMSALATLQGSKVQSFFKAIGCQGSKGLRLQETRVLGFNNSIISKSNAPTFLAPEFHRPRDPYYVNPKIQSRVQGSMHQAPTLQGSRGSRSEFQGS